MQPTPDPPPRTRTYDIPAMLTVHITDTTDEHSRRKLVDALNFGLTIDLDTGDGIFLHQAASLHAQPTPVLHDTDDPDHPPATFDPNHPCLTPHPDERLVTYDGEQPFPAYIDHHASGYRAPLFRPDVAIQLAHYVTDQNTTSHYPDDQHWLITAPDQRTIVHLVPDPDEHPTYLAVEGIYPLHATAGLPQLSPIGGWNWTWMPWTSEGDTP